MIPNINTTEQVSPTSLEIAFIETLIFYTCLDSFNEAIDSNGYVFQKTKDGAKHIHDITSTLWQIADSDECFEQRVIEYEHILKSANPKKNEPLTMLRFQGVNNFKFVNQTRKGGETPAS